MSDGQKKGLYGEIMPPERSGARDSKMQFPLELPPGVHDLSLGQALLAQIPYWGYRRALSAYRKAVQDQVATLKVVNEFVEAKITLDETIVQWNHPEERREAARERILATLDRARGDRARAEAYRLESEEAKETALQRKSMQALVLTIERYNLESAVAVAERKKVEDEERLKAVQEGRDTSAPSQMRKKIAEAKAAFKELEVAKAADIELYKGEENMPEYLQELYEKWEDEIGFAGG